MIRIALLGKSSATAGPAPPVSANAAMAATTASLAITVRACQWSISKNVNRLKETSHLQTREFCARRQPGEIALRGRSQAPDRDTSFRVECNSRWKKRNAQQRDPMADADRYMVVQAGREARARTLAGLRTQQR